MTDNEKNPKTFSRDVAKKKKKKILVKCPEIPKYSNYVANKWGKSFTIDWFDLLAVQRTLKSLLQHHFESIHLFLALNTNLPERRN